MTTIYFAGGEWDAFESPSGPPNITTSTTYYDNQFARCALGLNNSCPLARGYLNPVSQTDVWAHIGFCIDPNLGIAASNPIGLYNSAGTGVVRLNVTTSAINAQYWTGSAWTTFGTTGLPVKGVRHTLDIQCKIADSGGQFAFYLNGVSIGSFSGDTNLFVGSVVGYVSLASWSSSSSFLSGYSEIIVADTDTRAMRLSTLAVNANGTTTDWTGAYTDVNEVGVYNDSNYVSSGTPNQVELFGLSNLSATAATLDVVAVVVTGRARKGAGGPQNIQSAIQTGGVDYFSGSLPGLASTFSSLPIVAWSLNPNTSLPWSVSEVDALQAGFKSIT